MGDSTKTVSIYAPEDLVDEFDDRVWELKADGKIGRDASRSEVIRALMEEWAAGNSTSSSMESTAIVTAD